MSDSRLSLTGSSLTTRCPVCRTVCHRPRRRGTSLIEVLGTISVLLVLGVSSVRILGALTQIGARTSDARQGRAAIERFADVLRRDVHRADAFASVDGWPLRLVNGDETVEYQWDASSHSIGRSAKRGQQRLSVDRFRLPRRCDPLVTGSDAAVSIVLWDGGPAQQHPWIVEARVTGAADAPETGEADTP